MTWFWELANELLPRRPEFIH